MGAMQTYVLGSLISSASALKLGEDNMSRTGNGRTSYVDSCEAGCPTTTVGGEYVGISC